MKQRARLLLAGAAGTLSLAGCTTIATQDAKVEGPSAVSSTTAAAVSDGQRQQAQQLAEEAEKIMLDPALAPREKYPKALGMFRDALTIDPGNTLAKDSITLIEDIYKSMGRPVPQTT